MILKVLDKKKNNLGTLQGGFVYIDDIETIKIFWDSSSKFGIVKDETEDKTNPDNVVIGNEIYKFFVTEDDGNSIKVIQIKPHLAFVDLEKIKNELATSKIVYLSGGKIYKRNGTVEYFVMENRPCAFLMNDSGKTIEKLQRDV